jgi:hypothetical protein
LNAGGTLAVSPHPRQMLRRIATPKTNSASHKKAAK